MAELSPLDIFPYTPRGDQKKVLMKIYKLASEGKRILFQAPTGYGKTPVVLSALLPLAVEYNLPILWAVRTGGETDRVIEELEVIARMNEGIFGLSFRGKKDMCLLARDMNINDYESVSELCKRRKNRCPYYLKLLSNGSRIFYGKPLYFSEMLKVSRKKGICPYYAQFKILNRAIVVSLSYNYILSDYPYWPLRRYLTRDGAFLVIDEAHNIDKAVNSLNSITITLNTIERAEKEAVETPISGLDKGTLLSFIKDLKSVFLEEKEKLLSEDDILDIDKILDVIDEYDDLSLLEKASNKIISYKLSLGKAPRSSLRRLKTFIEAIQEFADEPGVVFVKYTDKGKVYFEVNDMRVAEILSEKWEEYESIIFMSGTLKPYDAFVDVVGVPNSEVVEGVFEIPEENVLPIIVRGVSTKGEELDDEMREKYGELLSEIVRNTNVNIAIFMASYRIQEALEKYIIKAAKGRKANVFIEREGMRGDEISEIYNKFTSNQGNILVGVLGGKFAEGMDYPGKALEGIVIVGIPFDRVNKRTQLRIEYYEKLYGAERGRYYSYIVPALRKVAQAMGRAIRSQNDRAFIIAADDRFTYPVYFNLLPEFFIPNVRVLKRPSTIVKYIRTFLSY